MGTTAMRAAAPSAGLSSSHACRGHRLAGAQAAAHAPGRVMQLRRAWALHLCRPHLVVLVGGLVGGAGDDEGRARLVDEDAVHLINDTEVEGRVRAQDQLRGRLRAGSSAGSAGHGVGSWSHERMHAVHPSAATRAPA